MTSIRSAAAFILALSACTAGSAAVIYQNDFETGTGGFSASGVLPALGTAVLPTDSAGWTSAQDDSRWLGRLGAGIAKSSTRQEIARLHLSGLVAGSAYRIDFDLFIGESWDGIGGGNGAWGWDDWKLVADGQTLVDSTFSNGQQGVNMGADSRQHYSDSAPVRTGTTPLVARHTGADFKYTRNQDGNYASEYSIYRFGRGDGNPVLTFVARASEVDVDFVRYSGSGDNAAEYWAIDNLRVTGDSARIAQVPLSGTLGLALGGIAACGVVRRRRRA